ncbi:hypothetical protein N8I77_001815 [Diaporthe amygdali]|uniref:Wax synthase domain-containing protein n=1 Tax=Phomopsis amygdali TaxID=1214568 RepID=A0AAD9SRB3_PHOAM|nr:hypothetical protein N8I77_001815 [Diaporthe amygdali]
MTLDLSNSVLRSVIRFFCTEAAFLATFTLVILGTAAQSTSKRIAGLAILCATTAWMESLVVPICLRNERPHWAATVASLLWVQFLSASDLVLVRRVHAAQIPRLHGSSSGTFRDSRAAVGLLWNIRRVGTPWQVKNVPSSVNLQTQTRAGFVLKRMAITLLAYLFVDAVVSMPPPEQVMVQADKATLFSFRTLTTGDIIFRCGTVVGYWLTTGILNLFMNNMGAIVAVLLGLSEPADCPTLYGSFSEAYTIRRFWGVSWHQMFRCFLTGHADLIVNQALPFVSRHSAVSRYTRLIIAFLISGLIHHHAEQLMGVPDVENGAVVFFLLHAAFIMLEDALGPVFIALLPKHLRHVLGYFWVFGFFVWTSPVWIYSGMRLGMSSAALLPVRVVGPWIERSLGIA